MLSRNKLWLNNGQREFLQPAPDFPQTQPALPEILVIASYPPRECGIATYSQDLVSALAKQFGHSFTITLCPLESETDRHVYQAKTDHVLNIDQPGSFARLAKGINANSQIQAVMIQHEFGLFAQVGPRFQQFLRALTKPVVIVFHTVLPQPDLVLRESVIQMAEMATSVVVMTHTSAEILFADYDLPRHKVTVIAHGTHLVSHSDKALLKQKYNLAGRTILSTFGLLSSGKSIETTLKALPAIVEKRPDVLFLIIGKTHPSVVKQEGEAYRRGLEERVRDLGLELNVKFINQFLPLPQLLEYLQLTDVYLFTSKDPNQAVSGTFSYAISCGCPIVSTPIPHAREVLKDDAGIIIDFGDAAQLAAAVLGLLDNDAWRKSISSNALHRMAATAWENAAIAHATLFETIGQGEVQLHYALPPINLEHLKQMTTPFGIIQFAQINQPDLASGYTLDDNARAMVAMCQHFELTTNEADIAYIEIYLNFIEFCLQPDGNFLNYVDEDHFFTLQNNFTNLEDANGRALWSLGYLISLGHLLPREIGAKAASLMRAALLNAKSLHSTRAMAFAIKGLYYRNTKYQIGSGIELIKELANRLVQMYRHEADPNWQWYEGYLTYANSILPEAMLCAWLATGDATYRDISKRTFDFLLTQTFAHDQIRVVSNQGWRHRESVVVPAARGGEQPIDVAYTVLALRKFYDEFGQDDYRIKLATAFSWFLGNNHLRQIIYNPCTGGCYDGLEKESVNLNQGAESTVSYLMARLVAEPQQRGKVASLGQKPPARSGGHPPSGW